MSLLQKLGWRKAPEEKPEEPKFSPQWSTKPGSPKALTGSEKKSIRMKMENEFRKSMTEKRMVVY